MLSSHQNLIKILDVLNDQNFHDGTSIGETLNITRAAVWKSIKKLRRYGLAIESVKSKGYRITKPMILLDAQKILRLLKQTHYPINISVLEKIDSTNDYIKQLFENSEQINIVVAETQTAGRGRFARYWHSPFGENIYFSMRYRFKQDITQLSGLGLVIAFAICIAIEETCSLEDKIYIKWPND